MLDDLQDRSGTQEPQQEPQQERRDSTVLYLSVGETDIDNIYVLLYEADGVRELEAVAREEKPGEVLELRIPSGRMRAVAIANLRRKLNTGALLKYESVELLSVDFADDSAQTPVMSGECEVEALSDTAYAEVNLTPLMCRVRLGAVTNNMDGYRRLEDPRVWLTDINASAEVMRTSGFRPIETLQDTTVYNLPCDVGFYTQYPMIDLPCYPNDTPESTLGVPRTGITLECEIKGQTVRFSSDLPPMERAAVISANLTVDSAEEYYWEF